MTIRGMGTLNNSSPLVVIDGIVGSMDDVNPNDVATMSVLKDAASSAIYGSRAANGVILITTKQGRQGRRASPTTDAPDSSASASRSTWWTTTSST